MNDTRAELFDRINQLMAAGALLVALVFATEVAQQLKTGWVDFLVVVERSLIGVAGLLLVWLAVLIAKKWRAIARTGAGRAEEGFTGEVIRRACCASWLVTLGFLVLFDGWLEGRSSDFISGAVMAVMFGAYGIAFFIVDHRASMG